MDIEKEQSAFVQQCMRRQGLSVVEGTYRSGKTTLAVETIHSLLGTSRAIKAHREQLKAEKKVKTYTIKELMECDSSDDEGYEYNVKKSEK